MSHQDSGTFFKVPGEWTVYEGEQVFERQRQEASPQVRERLSNVPWAVAIDAAPEPSLEHAFVFSGFEADTGYPSGYARVRELEPDERDVLSRRTVRNELLPIDQILEQSGQAEVVHLEEVDDEGAHGTHVVLQLRMDDGSTFIYDQIAMVDDDNSAVYLLVLGCESSCYEAHADDINEVTGSWTIARQ